MAFLDVNYEVLKEVKVEIEQMLLGSNHAKTCQIEAFAISVTDDALVNEIITTIATKFGRIDYVVNAAGITIRHEEGAAFASTTDWQKVIDIYLTGTFLVLRASAQIMLKRLKR